MPPASVVPSTGAYKVARRRGRDLHGGLRRLPNIRSDLEWRSVEGSESENFPDSEHSGSWASLPFGVSTCGRNSKALTVTQATTIKHFL